MGQAPFARAAALLLLVLSLPARAADDLRVASVLEEGAPGAGAPSDLSPRDFEVRWVGEPLPGVTVTLEAGRLQWLRVGGVVKVPRSRLVVTAEGAGGGTVLYAERLHPLVAHPGGHRAAIPVLLLGGEAHAVELRVRRGEETRVGRVELAFAPRDGAGPGLRVDRSCSPYALEVKGAPLTGAWGYVGCRLQTLEGAEERTTSLELALLLDGAGGQVQLGGVETPATSPSLWVLRLPPGVGALTVGLPGGASVRLEYKAPVFPRRAFVGVGVGPYAYSYRAPGIRETTGSPVVTLYGSYGLSQRARLVSFALLAPAEHPVGDLGLYLRRESFSLFDQRAQIAVFLGGHLGVFEHAGKLQPRLGLPQGAEFIWNDVGVRGAQVLGGGLLFPGKERTYYNLWLRWGRAGGFLELNFLLLREPLGKDGAEGHVTMRTFGLAAGVPLATFL